MTDSQSLFRAELGRIASKFEAADRRAKTATTIDDREQAEQERREAAGEFWAAGDQLADLFLMMLRYACDRNKDAVRLYLADILQPELGELAEAIARLEVRP